MVRRGHEEADATREMLTDGPPQVEKAAKERAAALAMPGGSGEEVLEGEEDVSPGSSKHGPKEVVDMDLDSETVWVRPKKRPLVIASGCDPTIAEKMGSLTDKMPVRLLEKRVTELGVRAFISTIPSQANLLYTIALNEFNHSAQRFPSVGDYEAARANYLEDIVVREAQVEDAITGNMLRIKDQTLHISTATDAQDNSRPIPAEWRVENVLDLVKLLLNPSPNRINGTHSTQPVLVRAGPGTGKTWMAKQAVFTLADRLLRGQCDTNGIRLVPIVVFVQRIIYLLREGGASSSSGGGAAAPNAGGGAAAKSADAPASGGPRKSLLERYIQSVYSGKKMEAWQTMLMQAYDMRALVVLLDGVDEAAGLRDEIEGFVHKEVVPSGNRVLVTSRPEGVQLSSYSKTFVVMNLCALTNEQQRRVINIQMQGNIFFDHLLSLGEVRKKLDDAYRKISTVVRNDLESLYSPSRWIVNDGEEPERQKEVTGTRVVGEVQRNTSAYLKYLDHELREPLSAADGGKPVCLLEQLDTLCRATPLTNYVEDDLIDALTAAIHPASGSPTQVHTTAVKLGRLMQKERVASIDAGTETKRAEKGKAAAQMKSKLDVPNAQGKSHAERLWLTVTARTDELYVVHEKMHETFERVVEKLVVECAREDDEAKAMQRAIEFVPLKDPVRIYEKADAYVGRYKEDSGLPEACVPDVTRARVVMQTGTQLKELVARLTTGLQLAAEDVEPVLPSKRAEAAEAAEQAAAEQAAPPPASALDVKLMHLHNRFETLDPTHFRSLVAGLKITAGPELKLSREPTSIYCELEIHYHEILRIAASSNPTEHYNFFRRRLAGNVPENELDRLLEEKLVFLVDATGVPVLLSLLVLIFTAGGEDLKKLPSNRIELYDLGIEAAISKRLLPNNRTSTDALVHDWLRLFNLDRSAMSAALAEGATEKKEREHRPTRKAALSMELSQNVTEKKMAAEAEAASKKKTNEQSTNKGDRKLFNLDQKEVYEVFKHGAHYLREANKPEVQRTELNRIELLMPKKLVDTVMNLVNANLKSLLGGKAQAFGLTMLRHVAVSNQIEGRREFSAVHVAKALLSDQMNPEGLTLWMHLNKEEAGLPLTKTLEAQTELAPAQYQFKHLSFQEGLFAQHLLIQANEGWETWETDETAAEFLNNPFMNNTCRIAAGHLGSRLSKRRPTWDFSDAKTRLTDVGLQALWLICEKNDKLQVLNLRYNGVGNKPEDSTGLAKMLITSTGLSSLNLGSNALGDLGLAIRAFGRGLSVNKTITQLDVSNNRLLPDGIKVVCNALRTCTAMRDLDLSYNSPGREAALSNMLLVHPTLRSVGVVEKEPTTRSERTFWLDTRGKEAIGRALLDSPGSVMFLQCDVFALNENTEVLLWTSRAPCDAIVLAGVLRSNTILHTLNIAPTGDIGDYEREEIGKALLTNPNGKLGFCDLYGLTEKIGTSFTCDLKDKDQIRSRRSFTLFAGLMRANATLTRLTLSSIQPEHIEVLAEALATNTMLQELQLEQPSKTADTMITTLPVQQLNGSLGKESIDLWSAGLLLPDGTHQPCHRHACGVVGAILGASQNMSAKRLRINPGGAAEGGAVLEHLHRARKSGLAILDVAGIGLGDRGGAKFFESLIEGKCEFLHSLHLGHNQLTDLAVGRLIVEVMRNETCNIATLDLNNNSIGAGVVTQAIKFNRSLTSLDITGGPIEDEGLGVIGELLLSQYCTCSMRYISCFAFEIKEQSSEVVMQDDALGEGAAKLLCGVFKYNGTIKRLNLSGKGIEPSAASFLAVAVRHNTTLESIDLSENPLSDVSRYIDARDPVDTKGLNELAEAVKASDSLTAITLDGGRLPVDNLKGADNDKRVRMLDLSRKALGFVSAIFIGTLLRDNSYIHELVLHSNELTPNGASFVVKQLLGSLKTLDIANTVLVEERTKGDKKADKKAMMTSGKIVPPEQLVALWSAITTTCMTLEKLTMDRDHLRDLSGIGKLLSLKTLSIANNKVASVPDDISLIKGLKNLTLLGNHLRELTASIGDLDLLERLDLKSNQLRFLPPSISRLRNLKHLDASENHLLILESSICDLHEIEKLELKDNPMQRPPIATARQGMPAIRKFFQEIVTASSLQFSGVRAMFIGHAESGKTTLHRAMRSGTIPPTREYRPTPYIETATMMVGEQSQPITVTVWDLAGQPEYAAGQVPYMIDGSIYVLVVPALDVAKLRDNFAKYVGRFLDMLQLSAPMAVVLPVITKCDLLLEASGVQRERTATAFEGLAAAQIAWLQEAIARHQSQVPEGTPRLRVQPAQCVSAFLGAERSVDEMRQRMEKVITQPASADGLEPALLPSVGSTISRTLFLTMIFVRALRDGREPVDSARAADLGYIPSAMSTEQRRVRISIDYEEANAAFFADFVPVLKLQVPSELLLQDTLKLMASTGEVAPAPGGKYYLQPMYLSRLIRPMCDDSMGNRLWQNKALGAQDAIRQLAGAPISETERNAIVFAAEALAKTGEVREELLPTFWEPIGLKRDEYADILLMLCANGMLCLTENTHRGRRWQMPMRLPATVPWDARHPWNDACDDPGLEGLQVAISFGACAPAGVFERLLAACQCLGGCVRTWRGGVHLISYRLEDVHHLLIEVRTVEESATADGAEAAADGGKAGAPEGDGAAREGYELAIEGLGAVGQRGKIWAALMHVKGLAQAVIDGVPMLRNRAQASLCCPACVARRHGDSDAPPPHRWPLEMVAKKPMQCEQCGETVDVYGVNLNAFAAPSGQSLLMDLPEEGEREYRFCCDKMRNGRPLDAYVGLYRLLGLSDAEEADRLKATGEQGIIDEFLGREAAGEAMAKDEYGWTDVDWLRYLTGFDAEASDKLAAQHAALQQQARANGFDANRAEKTIAHFASRPIATAAGLSRAHVLALRLYSSSVQHTINSALHCACSRERPHPYPVTVIMLNDALLRLKKAEADQRSAALQKATTLAEAARKMRESDEDDETKIAAVRKASEAQIAYEQLLCNTYWVGVSELGGPEFRERGATEVAFCNLARDKDAARADALKAFNAELSESGGAALSRKMRRSKEAAGGGSLPGPGRRNSLSRDDVGSGARSRRNSISREELMTGDGGGGGGLGERRNSLRRSSTSRDLLPPMLPSLPLGTAVAAAFAAAGADDDSAVPWIGAEELVPVEDEDDEAEAAAAAAAAEGEGEDSSDASDDEYVDGRRRRTYLAFRGKGTRPKRPEPPADSGGGDESQPSARSPSRLRRMPTQASMDREKGELPVLMLKVVTSTTVPVDFGFVTVFPASHMYVFPPCIYMEQRREVTEFLGMSASGEEVQCKVVEVLPSLQGRGLLGMKGPKASKEQAA